MMRDSRRKIRRFLGAAIVAAATGAGVTLAVLWLLSLLNAQIATRQVLASNVRPVVLSAERRTRVEEERRLESDPEPSEERVMTVDLDRPALAPLELEPLDLELHVPAPAISPVRLAVRPQAVSSERSVASSTAAPQTTTSLVDEGRVDQAPREHPGNRKPTYPPREERLGIEAQVVVLLVIDERGAVEDVQALSGPRAFRKAAIEAARSWSFTPAMDDGRAVKVRARKTINFEMPRR